MFALDRAFISGSDGSTHHGIYEISFLNAMPNMVITQPRNGHVLKELLQSAFDWQRPVAIRYPNMPTEEPDLPVRKRKQGRAEILCRGKNLLLVPLGHMYQTAIDVKRILEEKEIHPTIVDPVFVKPLDADLFCELLSTHPFVVTIEEHSLQAGLGMIFNHFCIRNHFTNHILNFGIPDTFVQHGSREDLYKELGLDAPSIAKEILNQFELKKEPAHDHRIISQ